MAGGSSRSNNRYNARQSFTPSNLTTQSLLQSQGGTNHRETQGAQPQQEPNNGPNPFRAMVQENERPRTIYVTFSVARDPLPVQDIKAYIDRFVGQDVATAYYMDMPKQGWIVLAEERYVDQLLGMHWIRNKTMMVKRFMLDTRRDRM